MPETSTPFAKKFIRDPNVLLSVEEMYRADALAIEAGVSGIALMEAAGRTVAEALMEKWPGGEPVSVLCGPGNNGGDGFVDARRLMQNGRDVTLYLMGAFGKLKGDAAHHAGLWRDRSGAAPLPLTTVPAQHSSVIIDAVFGAGLTRPIEGDLADLLERIREQAVGCLAVDLPSGLNGDTGEVSGYAPKADFSVTFFRKKPGHLIYPGRDYVGNVIVADIGTPVEVLDHICPQKIENTPSLWRDDYPHLTPETHKYKRGHLLVLGGEKMTGAARLAARAARRIGAGLATILTHSSVFDIYAKGDPGTIVETADTLDGFKSALEDSRRNAIVLGPGAGVGEDTRARCLAALSSDKAVLLDADAISSFQDNPDELFSAIAASKRAVVMTPHEGEFSRLFSFPGDKVSRTRQAAKKSGAVMLLKGADSIIASPSGYVAINANAPAELATAGSGDVLAGIIGALLAQGMPTFEAAAAGAWIHGECGSRFGAGLIAEDICEAIPAVITEM